MPELPEVEITVNSLKPKILSQKIIGVWFDAPNFIKKPSPKEFEKEIKNLEIKDIKRLGKNILIFLSQNKVLLIHQKLTGHLLYGSWQKEKNRWVPSEKNSFLAKDPQNRFIHFILFLKNKKMLALSDQRKFAKIILTSKEELFQLKEIKELGIDALDPNFTFEKLKEIVKKSKAPIKKLLMDQTKIAGIGNIYSDEILWEAKINPKRKANSLKENELKNLYQAIKKVLRKGIEVQGASIVDWRQINGSKGNYEKIRKVYQREGEKCFRCGSIIKKIKFGNRSSYYCPKCQK